MPVVACPDPACTASAIIVDRWTWGSTHGPVELWPVVGTGNQICHDGRFTNRPPTTRTAVPTRDQQAAQAKSPTAPVGAGQKAVGDLLVEVGGLEPPSQTRSGLRRRPARSPGPSSQDPRHGPQCRRSGEQGPARAGRSSPGRRAWKLLQAAREGRDERQVSEQRLDEPAACKVERDHPQQRSDPEHDHTAH
jgi:hypothetical protein